MILGRLEDSMRRAKEAGQTEATRDPSSVFPDIAMYVSLMRAFIAAKNPEAVEEVARRLRENLGWDDEYPPLQTAVKDLEELKLLEAKLEAKEEERAPRCKFQYAFCLLGHPLTIFAPRRRMIASGDTC
jgi:hypothetical protein